MKNHHLAGALILPVALAAATSCNQCSTSSRFTGAEGEVKLVVLDPGHFHAALVQKVSYPQVNPGVYVYAPQGEDVTQYLNKIASYNNRPEDPTRWNEIIYTGDDYLARMLAEHKGNVVILAGRNGIKTDYIFKSVSAGLNVLSDKPMAIDAKGFRLLLKAFDAAKKSGALLYDIMTERYEATNALQRELARMPELIGPIERGTPNDPAIIKESVHHFAKVVSGASLIRPEWYFDTGQQGEGIVDVTTHLVDLVQWTVAGEEPIDYTKEVNINSSRRWTTPISRAQYAFVTGKNDFSPALAPYIKNDTLNVSANGEINYSLRGVNVRVVVRWNYMAPAGTGDTHYALVRGSKGSVIVRQGAEQNYKPALYVEMAAGQDSVAFKQTLDRCVAQLASDRWPGLGSERIGPGKWHVTIPASYDVGHEAHFGQVAQKYLHFLVEGKVPDWEIANMKAKYFTTTTALERSEK